VAAGLLASLLAAAPLRAAADEPWPLAGRQGVVRLVIVPLAQARDRSAYARQIELLCPPEGTCFINFYSNSGGAPLAVPLPEAIGQEATAVFRRSAKKAAEQFQWSCRLRVDNEPCF
jgi:hypothetical protein